LTARRRRVTLTVEGKGVSAVPIYEYRCEACGRISSFQEKMFKRPRLFARKKRCQHCGSKKLTKVFSSFGMSVERTQNEMLNELKSLGNVQFTRQPPSPTPSGLPPGGCPYEKQFKEEEAKKAAEENDRKAREPIVVS
jgi:putative FmdB family regulatory protein